MLITLVAFVCTLNANIRLCEDVEVPTDHMTVGKIHDPELCVYKDGVPICTKYGDQAYEPLELPGMSYGQCKGGDSIKQASDWLNWQKQNHQQYENYYLQGVHCVVGKYVPSKRA